MCRVLREMHNVQTCREVLVLGAKFCRAKDKRDAIKPAALTRAKEEERKEGGGEDCVGGEDYPIPRLCSLHPSYLIDDYDYRLASDDLMKYEKELT